MTHVLVIEDHPKLSASIVRTLQESGFDATGVLTLNDATKTLSPSMGLVVLDLMLPDGSGLEWLASLRKADNRVPVLILTARDTIQDRVAGLDLGADDYLVKPFALDELLARIRALLRRDANPSTTALTVGELTVDFLARTAMRDSRLLDLQNRQFELLVYLMRHANEVVTREMIASDVWREPTATWTNVIDVHINQLRKKLEGSGRPALLHTIRGKGYVLGDLP
ncbi:response regulator transcription factor [Schlesneria paludicola]|uniref:response regulator transcription factor n=1 Tax=Schlesneria paludicola TaxID=360056 RepID=UPI00029AE413|nr:response regulator transcription factor [Schlesneria paludicola]